MSYAVTFRPKARKAFLALPTKVRHRLEGWLDALAENPRAGDNKPLKGKLRGLRRLRVGAYRVVFVVDDEANSIDIVLVGHRGRLYR